MPLTNPRPLTEDLDLFEGGVQPLGRLLDPASLDRLRTRRAPLKSIARHAPSTLALASEMRSQLPLRWEWLRPGANGEWYTETASSLRRVGKSRTGTELYRQGRSLQGRDLAMHLLGLTTAIGATDKPIGGNHDQARQALSSANLVPALRIDVDMPFAWLLHARREILDEIGAELRLFQTVGLPARVFRTGGKGHQFAVALPSPTPHSVASLIVRALRIDADRRRAKGVDVDVDNLSGHLRLAGGVHARTGRVGLWIDHSRGELHGASEQARLMTAAYRYDVSDGGWSSAEWEAEAASLRLLLWSRFGWDFHRVLRTEEAARAIDELSSESELCSRLQRSVTRTKSCRTVVSNAVLVPQAVPSKGSDGEPTEGPATNDWARRVWADIPRPGGFHRWLRMDGGKRGILAAAILFGPERGRDELLALARTVAGPPDDVARRIASIESFWPEFEGRYAKDQDERTKTDSNPPPASDMAVAAAKLLSESMARPKSARWRTRDAEAVVLEMLAEIESSAEACARIGCRALARRIGRRQGASPSPRRVADMVERLTEGTRDCVIPAFRRLQRVATVATRTMPDAAGRARGWVGEGLAPEYVVGPALAHVPLGIELGSRRERHLVALYGD